MGETDGWKEEGFRLFFAIFLFFVPNLVNIVQESASAVSKMNVSDSALEKADGVCQALYAIEKLCLRMLVLVT